MELENAVRSKSYYTSKTNNLLNYINMYSIKIFYKYY